MKEVINKLNKTAMYDMNGLKIEVTTIDFKTAWGNTRFLITPVAGTGEIWVLESSLYFNYKKDEQDNK